MAKFRDYLGAILAGGLPAVLDDATASRDEQGDGRPERTAPIGSIRDLEPFALINPNTGGINPIPLVIGAAFVLATIGLIVAVRK